MSREYKKRHRKHSESIPKPNKEKPKTTNVSQTCLPTSMINFTDKQAIRKFREFFAKCSQVFANFSQRSALETVRKRFRTIRNGAKRCENGAERWENSAKRCEKRLQGTHCNWFRLQLVSFAIGVETHGIVLWLHFF